MLDNATAFALVRILSNARAVRPLEVRRASEEAFAEYVKAYLVHARELIAAAGYTFAYELDVFPGNGRGFVFRLSTGDEFVEVAA